VPTKARRRGTRARTKPKATPSPGTLARRLARVLAERDAERRRHERQLVSLRQARDRELAAVVQDLAALRHHEARAAALTRLVAERDATLAAQAARIAHLEALLQKSTDMG